MVEINREYLIKEYGIDNFVNSLNIDLSERKIKKIDPNTFKGLTKLECLCLDFNEIEEIDRNTFDGLSNLTYLNLFSNKLKKIDRKCFESLKSIELIELTNNNDLKASSFLIQKDYLKLSGGKYLSDWNEFLKQFPEIGTFNSDYYYFKSIIFFIREKFI